jgi:hypothetical protein
VDPAYHIFDAKQISSWGANFVRVPFNSYWYNNDPNYRNCIRQWVDACANQSIYTVMDLHSHGSPPVQGPYGNLTESQAWDLFNTDFLPTLQKVVTDYSDQPFMIGIEVNEFWPLSDRSANWLFDMNMGNTLAQKIHALHPNLLVFIDTYGELANDAVIRSGTSLITEPNIVFAPHFYCAESNGEILHPIGPGKYGESDGWDFYYAYEAGNLTEGKTKLYHWLDLYEKAIQDIYAVPFAITEFSTTSEPNLVQALRDIMQYFESQEWGFTYLAYYGNDIPSLHLLYGDWRTLMPQGEAFVSLLKA